VREVKSLGLEACCTLGMLTENQAQELKKAGLDYYNHNLDTAPETYGKIISTRDYQDRLETLEHVRNAGVSVCCGGIVGMGESRTERAGLVAQLANMDPYPDSVPINELVQVEGTPLHGTEKLDPSSSCAPSPWRASPCPPPACACRPAAAAWARRAGPVLPGRCQLHLLRRQAADHRQPRGRRRPGAHLAPGPEGQARDGLIAFHRRSGRLRAAFYMAGIQT
jgi:hypothetical protein